MNQVTIYARKSTESEDKQVMSIDSQIKELKQHAKRMNWKVDRIFTESKSAKAPGREVFNELYKEIQQGQIPELLCWKLDRLARNPIDGGALIWALEENQLTHIHTPQSTFSNSGNDKFWLQMEFGMAKKYVDDLSDNVKRGLRAKIEKGWLPGKAPFGYKNEKENNTIIPDPVTFHTVRQLWDMVLIQFKTPAEIHKYVNSHKNIRDRLRYSQDCRPIARSTIFKILQNPFYYGIFEFNGKKYLGKHPPMITKSEFDKVQKLLDKGYSTRPKSYEFDYTGIFKCGECGASITAEHKKDRKQTNKYIYYHCTKKIKRCSQRYIEEKHLTSQIKEILNTISIDDEVFQILVSIVKRQKQENQNTIKLVVRSIKANLTRIKQTEERLLNTKLEGLISNDEYMEKKADLDNKKIELELQLKSKSETIHQLNKKVIDVFSFLRNLSDSFKKGSSSTKKEIIKTIGSKHILIDKKVRIHLYKPFDIIQEYTTHNNSKKIWLETPLSPDTTGLSPHSDELSNHYLALVSNVRDFYNRSSTTREHNS